MKLAHIINPVKAPPGSELAMVQPITFESIRVATDFAAGKAVPELYTVCFAEDLEIIPSFFTQLPNLTASVQDKLPGKRKLPFIKDILQTLHDNTTAEYLVYTNMDIALMPQFYITVKELLKEGHDALLINRRGISGKYKTVEELPLMYAEMGMPHPGFDCFIFHRSLLKKFVLAEICIGVPFVEVTLLHNMIAFAESLKLIDHLHLTFHIGTEVMPPIDKELYRYNRMQFEKHVYPHIEKRLDIEKFPYSELPLHKRLIKWVLNPCFRTKHVVELEGKSLRRKLKYRIDSLRFSMLNKIR